jgi:hypothetical protein
LFSNPSAVGASLSNVTGIRPPYDAVPCLVIDRIVNGCFVESLEAFDQLGMFQSLGTMPKMAAGV